MLGADTSALPQRPTTEHNWGLVGYLPYSTPVLLPYAHAEAAVLRVFL